MWEKRTSPSGIETNNTSGLVKKEGKEKEIYKLTAGVTDIVSDIVSPPQWCRAGTTVGTAQGTYWVTCS